jgi:hypothetical protein
LAGLSKDASLKRTPSFLNAAAAAAVITRSATTMRPL